MSVSIKNMYIGAMSLFAFVMSGYYLSRPFTLNLDELALILLGCSISYFFIENKAHRRFSVESVTILLIVLFSNIQALVIAGLFMSLSSIFGVNQKNRSTDISLKEETLFLYSRIVVLGYVSIRLSEWLDLHLNSYMSIFGMSLLFVSYLLMNEILVSVFYRLSPSGYRLDLKSHLFFIFYTTIATIFTAFLYYDRGLLLVIIVYVFLIPFHQMTNLYALYRSHEEEAMKDALTGLYNIRYFRKKIEEYVDEKTPFSLIMMDLDGFKEVNDHHGHLAGDEALRFFSDKVSSMLRKDDLLFRYAGDEFCILIASRDDVEGLVSRLKSKFECMSFPFDGKSICIGSSVGVCKYEGGSLSVDEIIETADRRLYKDKATRKLKEEA